MGLRTLHLHPIHDDTKKRAKSCSIEYEVDVGGFGVRAECLRDRVVAAQEAGDSGNELAIELGRHHFAEQGFLGSSVMEDLGRGQRAEVRFDNLVVAASVHPGINVAGIDAVALQVDFPCLGVEGHGVYDHAVEVE